MKINIKFNDCTFIVPNNDGESRKIIEICQHLNLDIRISQQKWGATLEKEPGEKFKNTRKNVVIIEIPGIEKEKELIKEGYNLILIDHHIYRHGETLIDRRNNKSSLEQFAELVEYSLNRFERGIALNDRGYIWLLRKEGYTDEEIDEIRRYDLIAQGYKEGEFNISINEYKKGESIPDKNLYIVETTLAKVSYIADMHQFKSASLQDLLILHNGNNRISEVNFYGAPERCKRLFSKFSGWIGGDEAFSMFWGCKENIPDRDTILEGMDYEPVSK